MILGEKGAGKEVVALYIQACSDRRSGPFVVANTAEITAELASARPLWDLEGPEKLEDIEAVLAEPGPNSPPRRAGLKW